MRAREFGHDLPEIVLIYQDIEEIKPCTGLINEVCRSFKALKYSDKVMDLLLKCQPKVLMLSMGSVVTSIEFYVEYLGRYHSDVEEHSVILMCKNKEAGMAFEACVKGLFDNYVVIQPLYEKYRLKYAVCHALQLAKRKDQAFELALKEEEALEQELSEVLDEGLALKKKMDASLSDCKLEVSKGADGANIEEILHNIEQDIVLGVGDMIDRLAATLSLPQTHSCELKHTLSDVMQHRVAIENGVHLQARTLGSQKQNEVEKEEAEEKKQAPSHVLVVEDNPLYRDMIGDMLRKEGYVVSEAVDGVSAIEQAKVHHPDLVLMDLFLPKLDGMRTTLKLRKVADQHPIRVIALTANKAKNVIRQWTKLGLDGYLVKPSTREQILAKVKECLESESPQGV